MRYSSSRSVAHEASGGGSGHVVVTSASTSIDSCSCGGATSSSITSLPNRSTKRCVSASGDTRTSKCSSRCVPLEVGFIRSALWLPTTGAS